MRIAVFFTPPRDHPLTVAAAEWLGRDAFADESRSRGPVPGFEPEEIGALTADPRRYGFHATLKPPFRIAAGHNLADIRAALAGFCRTQAAMTIPALELTGIGPFFALTAGRSPVGVREAAERAALWGFALTLVINLGLSVYGFAG